MKVTVFTPTYNRAHTMESLYQCMLRQTNKDFEWVIMDDGSSDNTNELIHQWILEGRVNIQYYKQENQGRFAAFNNVKKYFRGELILWCDSDDEMVESCIEKIIDTWNRIENRNGTSGIIGYMLTPDKEIIGTRFPNKIEYERFYVLYDKYRMAGDQAIVFRNDLVQKYSYPVFEGEKFTGDSILFNQISEEYPMYILREGLLIREYLDDGLTKNLLQHHISSPNGMREHYKDAILHEKYNKINICKHYIGYIAFAKFTGWNFKKIISDAPKKKNILLFYLPGCLYYGWKLQIFSRKYL